MNNILSTVEHDLAKVPGEVAHIAEEAFDITCVLAKMLTDAKSLTPQLKQELSTLVADAEAISTVLAPVVVSRGLNPALDAATLTPALSAIEKLVKDFVAFLPTLKQAADELKTDV